MVLQTRSISEYGQRQLFAVGIEFFFDSKWKKVVSDGTCSLPYVQWSQCPPRAGVGKLDAVYGTMDHYILWAARVGDFAARDRKRKLKVIKANGGEWRPPQGFSPPSVSGTGPSSGQGRPPTDQARSGVRVDMAPPMYGMIPTPGPIRTPLGFVESSASAPSPSSSEDNDLDLETSQAEREWKDLFWAGEQFAKAFGPGFEPLPPDIALPISTPFGPALQYRTNTIACIWAYYYTTKIILERVHPSMPPQAMVASTIAASKTAPYAQLIGRIVSGIYYPKHKRFGPSNISPALSAVLTEITMCLFFAGVQYMDPAQRGWTVAKLREITRLTGGNTPSVIAHGCETAWIKVYEAGRGPPYQRTAPLSTHINRGQGSVSESGSDRRFVPVERWSSLHHAMGVLSVEGDYEETDEGHGERKSSSVGSPSE